MSRKKSAQGNKYAALALPQSQLDFHQFGLLHTEQILLEVESFLQKCQAEGLEKILIITGKGLHSKNGKAVIKPLVQEHLRRSDLVKSFSNAPMQLGGEGAIMVTLQ